MITKELVEYIKAQRMAGKGDDEIKQSLVTVGGWRMPDVEEAFGTVDRPSVVPTQSVVTTDNVQTEHSYVQAELAKLTGTSPVTRVNSQVAKPTDSPAPFITSQAPGPQSSFASPVQQSSQFVTAQPSSSVQPVRKGKTGLVAFVLLFLLVAGGAGYAYWSGMFFKSTEPEQSVLAPSDSQQTAPTEGVAIEAPVEVAPTSTSDLWPVLDQAIEALKNKNVALYNAVSYIKVPPAQEAQFAQIADFLYAEISSLKRTDFVNVLKDDMQAIYSTDVRPEHSEKQYSFAKSSVFFAKDSSGQWTVLKAAPHIGYSIAKSATNKTASEAEADLRARTIDSDKDGITDVEETCAPPYEANPRCVKTDPNNKDTDSDGWWDGIEAEME